MIEEERKYGARFIEALKALHEAGKRAERVRSDRVAFRREREQMVDLKKDLVSVAGTLDRLADFLEAAKEATGRARYINKALGWVEDACGSFVHAERLWFELAGVDVDQKQFPPEKFVQELESAVEAKAGDAHIHIDLSQWKKSGSRNLLHDLLGDDLHEGVSIQPRRHGQNQPKELRRVLRDHELAQVAHAIKPVVGKNRTFTLAVPPGQITFDPPKT